MYVLTYLTSVDLGNGHDVRRRWRVWCRRMEESRRNRRRTCTPLVGVPTLIISLTSHSRRAWRSCTPFRTHHHEVLQRRGYCRNRVLGVLKALENGQDWFDENWLRYSKPSLYVHIFPSRLTSTSPAGT